MVGTEPHRGVDGLDVAHTLIERIDGLVDHRLQDAIDDEGGEVLGIGGRLAGPPDDFGRRMERRFVGGDVAYTLDDLLYPNRAHAMTADQPLPPACGRPQTCD